MRMKLHQRKSPCPAGRLIREEGFQREKRLAKRLSEKKSSPETLYEIDPNGKKKGTSRREAGDCPIRGGLSTGKE